MMMMIEVGKIVHGYWINKSSMDQHPSMFLDDNRKLALNVVNVLDGMKEDAEDH